LNSLIFLCGYQSGSNACGCGSEAVAAAAAAAVAAAAQNFSRSSGCAKKIEKKIWSFFSAKRLKKKLGHFLVQKD
jgi:hypothetical protein